EIANAHLLAVHQVQQPETGAIGERVKQQRQVLALWGKTHTLIIYALTDACRGSYIRFSVCEETQPWNRRRAFRIRSRKSTEAPRALWRNPAVCRHVATPASGVAIRSPQTSTVRIRRGPFRRKRLRHPWGAVIRLR